MNRAAWRDLPVSEELVEEHAKFFAAQTKGEPNRGAIRELLRSTAYHEGGHPVAVVHLYPLGTMQFATVRPVDEELAGFVRSWNHNAIIRERKKPWSAEILTSSRRLTAACKRDSLIAAGIVCYAGIAAQGPEFDPEGVEWVDLSQPIDDNDALTDESFSEIWERSRIDRQYLAELARVWGLRRPADRWHHPSWKRASRFVAEHWSEVEAVAAALLQSGHLDGEEVERIIEEAA